VGSKGEHQRQAQDTQEGAVKVRKISTTRERPPLRLTTKFLLAVVVAALGIGGFAGMAVAHTVTISSQHTVSFTSDVATDLFTGQVSSTKAVCERGRSIALYRVVGDSSVPDEKVTTATTNSSGVWSQGVGHAQEGTYYAVAARKVVQPSGHRHVCKAARSAQLTTSPVLEGLWLDPDTITVGQESTGTVSLTVATEEELTVSLESSDPMVATVPATVTVSSGQDQASFPITGEGVGSTTIKATLDDVSFQQTLTVNSP
jgi:hypothetical protein